MLLSIPTENQTPLERNVWRLSLFLIGTLLVVWQMPGIIALRNVNLSLLFLSALFLAWKMRHQLVLRLHKATLWSLLMLTGWIVIVILGWAAEPAHSWLEFKGQWLVSLGCFFSGAFVAVYASCSRRRVSQLVRTIFLALLLQVVVHDLMNVAYLLLTGEQPIRQAPVLYLPMMIVSMANGAMFVQGFIGERPDQFSYMNNFVAALLVAEIVQRVVLKKRWLPYSNTFVALAIGAVLLCSYWLRIRNGNVGLLMLMGLSSFLVLAHNFSSAEDSKAKMVRNTCIVILVLTGLGWGMLKSDSRWEKLVQTVPIAWDTQGSHAWITRKQADYPTYPGGEMIETTAYERIAWIKEGSWLALDNPLGTGYSRHAFGDGIDRKYDLKGSYRGGHAHSGVVDFAIANGIFGMVLWLAFIFCLFHAGWRGFRRGDVALGLTLMFLVSGFFSRSLVDSNMRDHVLQQFMFLAAVFYVLVGSQQAQGS